MLEGIYDFMQAIILFFINFILYELISFGLGGCFIVPVLRSKKIGEEFAGHWIECCMLGSFVLLFYLSIMYTLGSFRIVT